MFIIWANNMKSFSLKFGTIYLVEYKSEGSPFVDQIYAKKIMAMIIPYIELEQNK